MRRKGIRTTAHCHRCTVAFRYVRRGRHRYYCKPCVVDERKDANDFFNNHARLKRNAARMTAFLAHVEAEGTGV